MKTERYMTQTELAERWRISEATLERWRTESGGPLSVAHAKSAESPHTQPGESPDVRKPRAVAGLG